MGIPGERVPADKRTDACQEQQWLCAPGKGRMRTGLRHVSRRHCLREYYLFKKKKVFIG